MQHKSLFDQYDVIAQSGLFDAEYYLAAYTDVAGAGLDPLVHYLESGAAEMRNPSPTFSSGFYVEQCRARGIEVGNPLFHYLTEGHLLGLKGGDSAHANGLSAEELSVRTTIRRESASKEKVQNASNGEHPFVLAGHVDAITDELVRGWACNKADPDARVSVDIHVDGKLSGTVLARISRKDVAAAGAGTEESGFSWSLPGWVRDGKKHNVACFVGGKQLPMPEKLRKGVVVKKAADTLGFVDSVDADMVIGWAYDNADPKRHLQVDIVVDGAITDRVIADRPRRDVAEAGALSDACGFQWHVPPSLKDGKKHQILCLVESHRLPMVDAAAGGVYFSLSAEQLFTSDRPGQFRHISAGRTGFPDCFAIKAASTPAKAVLVAAIDDAANWADFDKKYTSFHEAKCDVILAVRKKNAIGELRASYLNCANLYIVEYSDRLGVAEVFNHLIESAILFDYEKVVLLNYFAGHLRVDESLAPYAVDDTLRNAGLIAPAVVASEKLLTPAVQKFLNVVLPRLGSARPQRSFPVPMGASLYVNPLLLRQVIAAAVKVKDLIDGQPPEKSQWFEKLLVLLGCFADEGCFSVASSAVTTPVGSPGGLKKKRSVKAIAFLLPQFHPVPENDLWWGRGFTEWNNVIRGKPLFRSHYQPRLPRDLGFYDLRHQDTQRRQAELAHQHSVYGFCYHYYWFDGKKMLNEPIEQMLSSGSPDQPFCVCWANENWSRNWDGQERYVLLKQNYSLESSRALIKEFIKMMRDRRYIRHQGKPVLVVYRIRIIPSWNDVAAMWREECRRAGIGEIHLCAVRFGLEPLDGPPEAFGLDAYVLFPPHETDRLDIRKEVLDLNPAFGGEIFSYDGVVEGDLARFEAGYPWPVHRGLMMGWDNTARRLTDARVFHGATPLKFRRWLSGILEQEQAHAKDEDGLLFINAWNEWAEGTVLEPDQKFGDSYLRAVRSVLDPLPERRKVTTSLLAKSSPASAPEVSLTARATPSNRPVMRVGAVPIQKDKPTIMLCAHISGHQLFGGERSFLDVIWALSSERYNLIVCLPSANNTAYIEAIKALSSYVYTFSYPQWHSRRQVDEYLTLNFAGIIAEHRVDLVYANTIVLLEPLIAAKRMKTKRLIHSREIISLDAGLQERLQMNAEEIVGEVFGRSDYIIANSEATLKLFSRVGRTFLVPNAIKVEEFSTENTIADKVVFGIVSSNIAKKGVHDFIEVARMCEKDCPSAAFVVIGPDNKYIDGLRTAPDLPRNVKFAGYRDSPVKAMEELNVLLSLSNFAESFGRTIAEAMCACRPVIAYEWGATGELVVDGDTGFLVPYRDVGAAAQAVSELCRDRARIAVMGQRGRVRIEESFSYELLSKRLSLVMRKIFGEADRRGLRPSKNGTKKSKAADVVRKATVIIPVFNAPDEVRECLQALRRNTDLGKVRVVVIDDGSTDARVLPLLEEAKKHGGIEVVLHPKNRGYTKTVNEGISLAGRDDVVLLNSDAVVTPNWFAGLQAAAFGSEKVGTVTAMSDNAGAFSFPVMGEKNRLPANFSRDDFAIRVVQAGGACGPVDVPTGSGFCMYIQRALLDQIGSFDEEAFPRGYGEENDFCMRARSAGWRNVITPWSYVYHVRTASFKGEKEKLVQAGVNVVTKRYPDYASLVREAFGSREMMRLRSAVNEAFVAAL